MNSNTTQMIEVQITYVNGWGDTTTTSGCFDSMEHLAEVLKASGQRIISIEITNK